LSKLNLELQKEIFDFFKVGKNKRNAYATIMFHFVKKNFSAEQIEEILDLFLDVGIIKEYSFHRYLELTEPFEQLLKLRPELALNEIIDLLSNELKYAEFIDSFTNIENG